MSLTQPHLSNAQRDQTKLLHVHYLHGKKETIDVIQDCMTSDEYHGYLKGNVLKYVSRYKFKGEPLEDLQKASWYLNRLIKEVSNGAS